MIVIGTDTHKRTHALSAVDEGTGRVPGSCQIDADEPGHLVAVKWARGLDEERVWAIEDCRQVSRRFEQALLAAGERVVRVAPQRMGASRRGERQPGKSDQIDSLAIARASSRTGSSSSRSRIWTSRRAQQTLEAWLPAASAASPRSTSTRCSSASSLHGDEETTSHDGVFQEVRSVSRHARLAMSENDSSGDLTAAELAGAELTWALVAILTYERRSSRSGPLSERRTARSSI